MEVGRHDDDRAHQGEEAASVAACEEASNATAARAQALAYDEQFVRRETPAARHD